MSTGGGPNSEIAKLSIGIEATGADAAVRDLETVRDVAEKTAESMRKATTFGQAAYPIETPAQSAARHAAESWDNSTKAVFDKIDGINQNMAAAGGAASNFNRQMVSSVTSTNNLLENIKETTAPLRQGVSLVSQFVGYTTLITGAAWGAYEAFDAINSKIEQSQNALRKAEIDYISRSNEFIFASEDVGASKRIEQIDEEQDRFEELQSAKAKAGQQTFAQAQRVIDKAREEFAERRAIIKEQERGDSEVRIASAKAAQERMAYEESQKRLQEAINEEAILGLKDEERVRAEGETKRAELNQRINAESRESVRESLFAELVALDALYKKKEQYAKTEREERERKEQESREKQEAAEQERAAKELERQQKMAESTAEAYRSAIESASRSAADALRSQLDISGISTQLEGVADLLDMIARQRGVR